MKKLFIISLIAVMLFLSGTTAKAHETDVGKCYPKIEKSYTNDVAGLVASIDITYNQADQVWVRDNVNDRWHEVYPFIKEKQFILKKNIVVQSRSRYLSTTKNKPKKRQAELQRWKDIHRR